MKNIIKENKIQFFTILAIGIAVFATILVVSVRKNDSNVITYEKPDIEEIRSICSLATTEIDYNNVAKSSKKYWFFKPKIKKLWIEHKGVVKIGIDINKLELIDDEDKWIIKIPKAEVLNVSCDPNSFTEESFTMSDTSMRRFSSYEQNAAMAEAIGNMKADAESNSGILHDAQVRAKKILENYFSQLNKKTGSNINIVWELQ